MGCVPYLLSDLMLLMIASLLHTLYHKSTSRWMIWAG